MATLRGADIVARALAAAGVRHLFSLSGNQIMPVYDAALEARLAIVHVRHEGAAVHMADAWGRLTGEPGVALLTGGPGHANGVGALYTALAAESPMVLLSGHAPLAELGRGAFQEMRQSDLAAPVTKDSWTVGSAATLGEDIRRALNIARSGRPGPVHVSLPFDVLEARVAADAIASSSPAAPPVQRLGASAAEAVRAELARAQRPLVLAGPAMANGAGRAACERLAEATGAPVVCMESPRGVNDPALGAFADVLREADLVVLLGKQPDFTLRFGAAPALAADCRFIVIDPEPAALQRALKTLAPASRVRLHAVADSFAAAEDLAARGRGGASRQWAQDVEAAIRFRPAEWRTLASRPEGPLHPVEVGRAVQRILDSARDAVLVADGGEFGQWAQACTSAPARLINGPAGSIGSAIPFALAARLARPDAAVVALLGDGTFGFHLAEVDTAARARLPFLAVVGNDACWNAEHQIQLKTYGRDRAHGCELLPTRYDQAVMALGGHGEHVTRAADLAPALERALASQRPACVNVMIERAPAPTAARGAALRAGAAH
ncbi:MAG TPA: thiamine pyrophosphate-binding protein [Burkholderiales bacterium]|nr:thiamine pyrophosphate-binding protein [Burkholderiales bacterium]